MILEWVAQAPVLIVVALVVFVPGVAALWRIIPRGLALLAAAPLFTVAVTALLAVAYSLLGVAWSPLSWLLGTAVLVSVAWAGSGVLGPVAPQRRDGRALRVLLPLMIALGISIGIWRLASYITDPAGISQTNDAVFHMNAVRYVLETADASSFNVNGVIGGRSFYPAGWHALVSLVVAFTGTTIPIAANMLTLVIGGLIWPLGIVWLTRTLTRSDAVAGFAALLSGALQTFPLLMFQWGVLFPNALSTALIPAAIAIAVTSGEPAVSRTRARTVVRVAALVLLALTALAFSQPAALLPWAAILAVRVTDALVRRRSEYPRWRTVLVAAVMWIVLAAVWIALSQSTSGSHWPPFRGKLEVFLDVLFNGQVGIPFAFGVSALMLVGVFVAWRAPRIRWFVFAWSGISALYVLVAAVGAPLIRENILGAWYADPYRIAALSPLVVIPLAALGFSRLAEGALRILRRRGPEAEDDVRDTGIAAAALAALMIVLVVFRPVAMPAFLEGSFDRESRYLATDDSYLSPDERTLLESLPDTVEPGARVLGNPSTGSGFGFMLSGVDVYPRTWSKPESAAWEVLAADLRDAATDPDVCAALETYGSPEYVLDFGPGEQAPGRYLMPGMTDFEGRPGFDLVSASGDASLWRITACAR